MSYNISLHVNTEEETSVLSSVLNPTRTAGLAVAETESYQEGGEEQFEFNDTIEEIRSRVEETPLVESSEETSPEENQAASDSLVSAENTDCCNMEQEDYNIDRTKLRNQIAGGAKLSDLERNLYRDAERLKAVEEEQNEEETMILTSSSTISLRLLESVLVMSETSGESDNQSGGATGETGSQSGKVMGETENHSGATGVSENNELENISTAPVANEVIQNQEEEEEEEEMQILNVRESGIKSSDRIFIYQAINQRQPAPESPPSEETSNRNSLPSNQNPILGLPNAQPSNSLSTLPTLPNSQNINLEDLSINSNSASSNSESVAAVQGSETGNLESGTTDSGDWLINAQTASPITGSSSANAESGSTGDGSGSTGDGSGSTGDGSGSTGAEGEATGADGGSTGAEDGANNVKNTSTRSEIQAYPTKARLSRWIGTGYQQPEIEEHLVNRAGIERSPEPQVQEQPAEWLNAISSTEVQKLLIHMSGCYSVTCNDRFCLKGRDIASYVEEGLRNGTALVSDLITTILDAILEHSRDCLELRCPVFLCSYITYFLPRHGASDSRSIMRHLQTFVKKLTFDREGKFLQKKGRTIKNNYFPIDSKGIDWLSVELYGVPPEPEVDYSIYGCFNGSFRSNRVHVNAVSACGTPFNIKLTWMATADSLSKSLLESMKDMRHSNIVRHFWSIVHLKLMTVASQLYFDPGLDQVIDSVYGYSELSGCDFTCRDLVLQMRGLLEALQYLHTKKIFYLNWIASSIVVCDCRIAKLQDFSCSISFESCDEAELIISILPPQILPPELIPKDDEGNNEAVIDEKTDVWCFGTLLRHVATGQPVHYDNRHDPRDVLYRKMQEIEPKDLLYNLNIATEYVRNVLSKALQVYKNRTTVEQLVKEFDKICRQDEN